MSKSQAHDSIQMSMGQSELAERVIGGHVDAESKRIATDEFLEAADKLGVVSIGR